jgi:RNA polymerase sigma-70 factor (ECF subfamily)
MATSTLPVSLFDSTHIPASRSQRLASPSKFDLDDVLARAQAGDPDAFSQLYLLHKKRVFTICVRMVRDFSMAEDLTQETFLQLHRKLASFRGESLFTTWLHRMTVNIVLMRLRKRVLPVVSLDQMMTEIPETYAGRSFGAYDRAQTGVVDRVTIERALGTLPSGYRKVFLLHDVHGFEHREIASMEGFSLGNSKSQLHRARRAMRSALTGQARRVPDQERCAPQDDDVSGMAPFQSVCQRPSAPAGTATPAVA